jgi:(p)ppGpp synthase/HD superfamily hydrolase
MGAYAQTHPQLQEQLRHAGRSIDERLYLSRVHRLAVDLFTGQYRGSERPFTSHLVGTASVLLAHGASLTVVAAGLLHAAHERGDFGSRAQAPRVSNRDELSRCLGAEAAALVDAYASRPWNMASVAAALANVHQLDDRDFGVLSIRLANELDDHLDLGILYCADAPRRLERIARLGAPVVALARALGHAALADELDLAFGACRTADVPDCLRGPHGSSYVQLRRVAPKGRAARILAALANLAER